MKNNYFFYMFYNNMYETSSKLNEIILLNRQLRNFLSMKGGGRQDLLDFKNKGKEQFANSLKSTLG